MNRIIYNRKSQKDEEDEKDKRSEKNRRGERDKDDHCKNKINPMIGKNNSSRANIYYYIIY